MSSRKVKNNDKPASAAVRGQAAGGTRRGGPRAPLLTASLIAATLLVAFGAWLVYSAVNRPLGTPADPAELSALDARLTAIENAARPIAAAFASESPTAAIDVTDYRDRVVALRKLVDSTNDLAASSPDALEIRDLILTGGSEIGDGMNAALDALVSDEASATTAAAAQVDDGLSNLDAARAKLDLLLGRIRPA